MTIQSREDFMRVITEGLSDFDNILFSDAKEGDNFKKLRQLFPHLDAIELFMLLEQIEKHSGILVYVFLPGCLVWGKMNSVGFIKHGSRFSLSKNPPYSQKLLEITRKINPDLAFLWAEKTFSMLTNMQEQWIGELLPTPFVDDVVLMIGGQYLLIKYDQPIDRRNILSSLKKMRPVDCLKMQHPISWELRGDHYISIEDQEINMEIDLSLDENEQISITNHNITQRKQGFFFRKPERSRLPKQIKQMLIEKGFLSK